MPEHRTIDTLLAQYSESHLNPTNEVIHFICVPVIVFTLLGLLWSLHPLVALAFAAASMVYYFRLSRRSPGHAADGSRDAGHPGCAAAIHRAAAVDCRVCAGLDRPVHRPQDRRQEALVLRRPALPADRPLFVLGFLYRRLHLAY
jgi:hypothetical protein